jgi:hypothetical protein
MDQLFIALLFVCGGLAVSGRLLASRPNVVAVIDRFDAVQAFAGVAVLGLALWTWFRIGAFTLFKLVKVWPFGGIAAVSAVLSGIALGVLLGMPRERPSARVRWYWIVAGALAVLAAVMLVVIRVRVIHR